jgi:hypothetical protein
MANVCAWCRSADTQQSADRYKCFDCGRYSDQEGRKAPDGLRWTSEKPPLAEPYQQFPSPVPKNPKSRKAHALAARESKDRLTTTRGK